VLAFRKPDTIGDHSLWGYPAWDYSKGRKISSFSKKGMWAGVFRLAGWPRSCPRLQAPAAKR